MNASFFDAPCLSAALEYAARGWHVFPATVEEGQKKGCIKGENANGRRWGNTADPDLIRQYWRQFPDAMVGIACGRDSGLFVVDVDTLDEHGEDGMANMRRLIAEHGPLPDTIEVVTPSGGWHIYFAWPDGEPIRNSSGKDKRNRGIAPGIDVRGEGGMVIAPPSSKPGGSIPYRAKNPAPMFELAACPEWLLAMCRKLPRSTRQSGGLRIDTGRYSTGDGNSRLRRYGQAALAREAAEVAATLQGNRNVRLNDAALKLGHLVPHCLAVEEVEEALMEAAEACGLVPDDGEAAAMATIRSGLKAGMAEPRYPSERDPGGFSAYNQGRSADGEGGGEEPAEDAPDAGTAPLSEDGEDDEAADTVPPPAAVDVFDLSHDALARDIGACGWDSDARHVSGQGRWYFWDGIHWQPDEKLTHMTRARGYLGTRAADLMSWAARKTGVLDDDRAARRLTDWARSEARTLRSASTVAAVVSLARSNPASVTSAAEFDRNLMILGTPAGTVDLRTGELRTARRDDMVTKLTTVAPAPTGTVPALWLRFLSDVLGGDEELVGLLQRAAGYGLTGLTTEHKLLFLFGTGRNGKSTFLNVLLRLWGAYARRVPASTLLSSPGGHTEHATHLAGLAGTRLAVASELPKGRTWDEAIVKDLTGGDRMTARLMRQDYFDFDPQLTLMIAGNNRPSFRGVDEAIRARVVLVPFTVTIPPDERDHDLTAKLIAEGPAILRWAIDGALEWQRRGLAVPASVAAASAEYMDDEDILGRFLGDRTSLDPDGFELTTDLHNSFRFWCDGEGLNPWTRNTFRKELIGRGFEAAVRNHGRGHRGLRLNRE